MIETFIKQCFLFYLSTNLYYYWLDKIYLSQALNEFVSNITGIEQTNAIKNTDLMSDFTLIPSDIRSGCISLSYTNPTDVREVMNNKKLIRLLAMISSQHMPWKSQPKSYAVLLAHYLISFSTQAKFLKCGKKVK